MLQAPIAARPTTAATRAYGDALALATQPVFSPERARARVQLALGLAIGRRALARDASGPITLGSAGARIAAGGSRTITVRISPLGRQALRIIDLARAGKPAFVRVVATLTRGGKTSRASRALPLG